MRSLSGGGEARRLFRDVVAVRHEQPLAPDAAPDTKTLPERRAVLFMTRGPNSETAGTQQQPAWSAAICGDYSRISLLDPGYVQCKLAHILH